MLKSNLLLDFGAAVRKFRLKKGLSQEQLAEVAGLHRTYIGMIERGEKNVTLKSISKLALALKIHPSKLLEDLK